MKRTSEEIAKTNLPSNEDRQRKKFGYLKFKADHHIDKTWTIWELDFEGNAKKIIQLGFTETEARIAIELLIFDISHKIVKKVERKMRKKSWKNYFRHQK